MPVDAQDAPPKKPRTPRPRRPKKAAATPDTPASDAEGEQSVTAKAKKKPTTRKPRTPRPRQPKKTAATPPAPESTPATVPTPVAKREPAPSPAPKPASTPVDAEDDDDVESDQELAARLTRGPTPRETGEGEVEGFATDEPASTVDDDDEVTDSVDDDGDADDDDGDIAPSPSAASDTDDSDDDDDTDDSQATIRLEVEVDFKPRSNQVTLRFQKIEGDNRNLMRIQDLYNTIQRIRRGNAPGWRNIDRRFLKQIWAEIDKPHLIRNNFQVLKISRRTFNRWLDRWKAVPERFIERRTGNPFTKRKPRARLYFDLTCRGETSTLAALVHPPKGAPIPYHKIQPANTGNPDEIIVRDQVLQLDCPVPRALLDEVFGETVPTVPTDKIVDHLPVLLQGRLDLLRGRSVKQMRKVTAPRLRLRVAGGDLLIGVWLAQAPLMQPDARYAYALRRQRNRFVVTQYQSDDLQHVYELFRRLKVQPDTPPWVRMHSGPDQRALLKKTLKRLPKSVNVEADDEVRLLIAMPALMETQLTVRQGTGWFDVELSCRVGNTELSIEEIHQMVETDSGLVRTRAGGWLPVDPKQVDELRRLMKETNMVPGVQRMANPEAVGIIRKSEEFPDLRLHRSAQEIADALAQIPAIGSIPLSERLRGILRDYQVEGAEFLYNRTGYDLGCILADDMGLGKTLEVLAYFDSIRDRDPDGKHLVVCPASVLSVWRREAEHFTPNLRVEVLTGPPKRRQQVLQDRKSWDIVIATYAIVRNDAAQLAYINFSTMILDEAQQIKNPDAQITQAVKGLTTSARIAVTGTPLENRLDDLWSIVDFLNPGYLGSQLQFQQTYVSSPEERGDLSRRIAPLMLRRTKEQVAKELPPRIMERIDLPLTASQRKLYKQELEIARNSIDGSNKTMEILAALTKLRQVCCHPRLVLEDRETSVDKRRRGTVKAPEPGESTKVDFLLETLDEIMERGHSALVFSQFTRFLDIIQAAFKKHKVKHFKITGETKLDDREKEVAAFNESKEPSAFLLSLRAAGTGLTLTKADYVFICDPWWNPAVENQAIDRAHRIGQDKAVIAYRLVTEETVEEKVLTLQDEKRLLFAEMIDGADQVDAHLGVEELLKLLS